MPIIKDKSVTKTAGIIKESLDFLTDKIHKTAISKGWWEEERE